MYCGRRQTVIVIVVLSYIAEDIQKYSRRGWIESDER